MHPFLLQTRRFHRDERGVFAVVFALTAIVLIAFGGLVVDYSMLQQRRNVTQVALDAADLALQGEIATKSKAQISEMALGLLRAAMSGDPAVQVSITNVEIDVMEKSLRLVAKFDAPSYFVTLVGVHSLGASVESQATRRSDRIEIAMVLDNSGSMAEGNRMLYLRQAATNATEIFFKNSVTHDPHMFVGLVPFTQYVNVGAHNAKALWIDRQGKSSIAGDNFTIDANSPVSTFDRIGLFNSMATERWRGCVEARVFPYDTNDTTPTPLKPDTLFLPLLAPDEPDTVSRGNYVYNNHYIDDQRGQCAKPLKGQSWSERTLQERMCKYNGASLTRSANMQYSRGPNADCPTNALTPLSSNQSEVKEAIREMYPQGGTNIAQGAVWGLHMLTPGLPLDDAEEFDNRVMKVMILMTDGDNFHASSSNMNGATFYTAYGYPHNRRLGKPGEHQ